MLPRWRGSRASRAWLAADTAAPGDGRGVGRAVCLVGASGRRLTRRRAVAPCRQSGGMAGRRVVSCTTPAGLLPRLLGQGGEWGSSGRRGVRLPVAAGDVCEGCLGVCPVASPAVGGGGEGLQGRGPEGDAVCAVTAEVRRRQGGSPVVENAVGGGGVVCAVEVQHLSQQGAVARVHDVAIGHRGDGYVGGSVRDPVARWLGGVVKVAEDAVQRRPQCTRDGKAVAAGGPCAPEHWLRLAELQQGGGSQL